MTTRREKIISKALFILESKPNGIKRGELCQRIKEEFPIYSLNYIHDIISLLHEFRPDMVYKPERGLFRHIKYKM